MATGDLEAEKNRGIFPVLKIRKRRLSNICLGRVMRIYFINRKGKAKKPAPCQKEDGCL
jgi:hypothetical protein